MKLKKEINSLHFLDHEYIIEKVFYAYIESRNDIDGRNTSK